MDFIRNNKNVLIVNLLVPIVTIFLLGFFGVELFNEKLKVSYYEYRNISYNIPGLCVDSNLNQKEYGNYGKPYGMEKIDDKIFRSDKDTEESVCRVTLKYKRKHFTVSNSIYSLITILFTILTSIIVIRLGYKKFSVFYVLFFTIIFLVMGFYFDIYSIHIGGF